MTTARQEAAGYPLAVWALTHTCEDAAAAREIARSALGLEPSDPPVHPVCLASLSCFLQLMQDVPESRAGLVRLATRDDRWARINANWFMLKRVAKDEGVYAGIAMAPRTLAFLLSLVKE